MKNQYWYFLVHGFQNETTGVFGNFYAYGSHCGDALNRTLTVAAEAGMTFPHAMEAARLDSLDNFQTPEDVVSLNDNVFMRSTLYSYDLNTRGNIFVPPTGVLMSADKGAHDYELIQEKFAAYNKDENGVFTFELVVNKNRLVETFFKSIEFLPAIDGFWIYVGSQWDNEQTELWAAKHFTGIQSIVEFLLSNERTTLDNGYVKCVVHCAKGETNLTLDDHKKIQLFTKDENLFNDFINNMAELGFEEATEFYNLESGCYHWHYRPFDSLTRNDFKQTLQQNGFELIGNWNDQ